MYQEMSAALGDGPGWGGQIVVRIIVGACAILVCSEELRTSGVQNYQGTYNISISVLKMGLFVPYILVAFYPSEPAFAFSPINPDPEVNT